MKELSFNLQKGERVCAMDKYELILDLVIWDFKHLNKKKQNKPNKTKQKQTNKKKTETKTKTKNKQTIF